MCWFWRVWGSSGRHQLGWWIHSGCRQKLHHQRMVRNKCSEYRIGYRRLRPAGLSLPAGNFKQLFCWTAYLSKASAIAYTIETPGKCWAKISSICWDKSGVPLAIAGTRWGPDIPGIVTRVMAHPGTTEPEEQLSRALAFPSGSCPSLLSPTRCLHRVPPQGCWAFSHQPASADPLLQLGDSFSHLPWEKAIHP